MPAVVIFIFFVIEFIVSGWFISAFSGTMFFAEIVTTGIIGLIIISSMGHHLNEAMDLVRKGELHPQELLTSAVGRVFGGVLFFIPGVFTDVMGLILLIKAKTSKSSTKSDNTRYTRHDTYENVYRKEDDDIIDVEVVEEENNGKISNSNERK